MKRQQSSSAMPRAWYVWRTSYAYYSEIDEFGDRPDAFYGGPYTWEQAEVIVAEDDTLYIKNQR